MRLFTKLKFMIAFVALAGSMLVARDAVAQLPNSPCGYCSWIELVNDPIADGIVTEDGVTGYVYVYDVWIANFGTDNWEASYALGGTHGPLGEAGTFDGTQSAYYRESTIPEEDLGDTAFKGVWSVWYNSSAGQNSDGWDPDPYTPARENAPSAVWNKETLVWETDVVDQGNWVYTGHPDAWADPNITDPVPADATQSRFADLNVGDPLPWAMDNPFHTGDEYRFSSEYRYPGIAWSNTVPVDKGLVWGKAGGVWSGWDDGLEATIRIVHPNSPGSINYSFVNVGGAKGRNIVTGPNGPAYEAPSCDGIVGDANCDGYVDVGNDIFPAFSNFTGPGSFGMERAQGDVQGNATGATANLDPHDGDVDVSDIITMFSNFTGPAPPSDEAGGLVAAEALDSTIPDLIYDASTGEVLLDLDSAVGFTGYVLNSANGFITGNHTPFMAGVTTTLPYELAEATFGTPAGPYPKSIGNVFPSGMDMAALSAFLTGNQVSRGNNQPIVPFDLVIVNPVSSGVPEPAAVVMGLMALAGLGMVAYRRRRAA